MLFPVIKKMSNKFIKTKTLDKSSIIKLLQAKIADLINRNNSLLRDKLELENSLKYYRTLEDKINKIRDKYKDMQKKYDELTLQKEKELKEMKLKYEHIIHEKEYELEKYQTNISIYNQKMNMVRQIEMENDIFKNEINELKDKNEELIKKTKNKLEDLEIQNKIKYNHLKLSMVEHLKEAKKKVTNLNLKYMDTNGQISVLQNQKLLENIESIQIQCDSYQKQNVKLKQKIKELKNEIALHKKIEVNLTLKMKQKENHDINNSNDILTSNNQYNKISLTNYDQSKSENNSISPPPLLNNSNKISNNLKTIKKNKLIKNKKVDKNLVISNSLSSSDNELDNFFMKNSKNFNYRKYKLKLKEKDEKIDYLELQVDKLNHKLDSYFMKYKGLFNYIEYCINEFYHDEKLMNINSGINIENIKKFEFDSFNKKEQYSILVLLMNNLMKILCINYPQKNTDKDPPFFATNLKYMNTKFNLTKGNFNNLYIKNPFVNRNSKLLKTFNSYRMNKKCNFSISALNENSSTNDYRIFDKKYQTLI